MKLVNILFIFSIFFGIAWGNASAQDKAIEEIKNNITSNTLIPFVEAVKNGDVEKIKLFLSEDEYKAYRVLLEQNPGYPDFLRRHYKDVTYRIKEVTPKAVNQTAQEEGNLYYRVELVFPDGKKEVHKLVLKGDS